MIFIALRKIENYLINISFLPRHLITLELAALSYLTVIKKIVCTVKIRYANTIF